MNLLSSVSLPPSARFAGAGGRAAPPPQPVSREPSLRPVFRAPALAWSSTMRADVPFWVNFPSKFPRRD